MSICLHSVEPLYIYYNPTHIGFIVTFERNIEHGAPVSLNINIEALIKDSTAKHITVGALMYLCE